MAVRLNYTGEEINELLDIVKQGGLEPKIIVDEELSTSSINPVQNKVITSAISESSQIAIDAKNNALSAKELAQELNESIKDNINDIDIREGENKLVFTRVDGTTDELEISTSSDKYEPGITDLNLKVPNDVGGITKDTTLGQLKDKTFSQLFDDLLFPSIDPTHGTPSLSGFALSSSTSPVELGTSVPSITTAGLNKSTWTTFNNDLAYAGDVTSVAYEIKINGKAYNSISGLPSKFDTLGSHTYTATVNYGKGPTPVNNKGVEVPSLAAPAGSVTATRTINVTAPWYASTSTATATNPVVKQSLVSWNKTAGKMSTGQFKVQPSGTLPQVFKLPRKIDVLQLKNALNGNMENVEEVNGVPKDYTETTEVINIGDVNITYYVYTYSGSTRGEVTLLAKF